MRALIIVAITAGLCLGAAPLALPVLPRAFPSSMLLAGAAFGVAVLAAVAGVALLVGARRRPRPDVIGSIRMPPPYGADVAPPAGRHSAPDPAPEPDPAPAGTEPEPPRAPDPDGWRPAAATPLAPDEPGAPGWEERDDLDVPDGWVPGFDRSPESRAGAGTDRR